LTGPVGFSLLFWRQFLQLAPGRYAEPVYAVVAKGNIRFDNFGAKIAYVAVSWGSKKGKDAK
jgi:hypothetical protein